MQQDHQKNSCPQANFLIQIQYRHNSSWQGRIVWLDTKKVLVFRSFLELVMLIREALDGNSYADQLESWENRREVQ